jgi:hypothetical protein
MAVCLEIQVRIVNSCVSAINLNAKYYQHDDSPSIQATLKCTTFQLESYRIEEEGCLAQDTAVVEHFEKYNWSLPNPWIGIVS